MPLPADLQSVVDMTLTAGRAFLSRAGDVTAEGAAQAAAVIEAWGKRMAFLAGRFASGKLDRDSLAKAIRSEAEALPLNLAAIVNETRRALLADLLQSSLSFILELIGGRP